MFYICEDSNLAISHAKRKYNVNFNTDVFDGSTGICLQLTCKETSIPIWMVWIAGSENWKIMVHETAHLVFNILNERGVSYSGRDNETWCYLQEYFISEFWHVMRKR